MIRYYTIAPILSYKMLVNIIVGQRSVGKSYAVKTFILKKAIKEKKLLFVYLRRTKEEVKESIGDFMNDIHDLYKDYEFKRFSNKLYTKLKKENEWHEIGRWWNLNDEEKYKSIPLPHVKYLVFEEFATKASYKRNEFKIFYELISSVFRLRDLKIFMLGNKICSTNPYFDNWGINYDSNKRFIINKSNGVILENVDASGIEYEKSPIYKLFKNTIVDDYLNDKFLEDDTTNVCQLKSLKTPLYNVVVEKEIFTIFRTKNILYVGEYVRNDELTYCLELEDLNIYDNSMKMTRLNIHIKKLLRQYEYGNVCFENQKVKNKTFKIFEKYL